MVPERSFRFTSFAVASFLVAAQPGVDAQTSGQGQAQIETARAFNAAHGTQTATTPHLAAAGGNTGLAVADGDSFGVQELLREAERPQPFRVFADLSAFVTNNVALTHQNRRSDAFLLATFGFEYRRPLRAGFELEASAQYALFRYDRSHGLDFSSVDAALALNYHAARLGGIDFFLQYAFNELITAGDDNVFFTDHAFIVGAQKVFPLGKAHSVYVGAYGDLAMADPKISERWEIGGYAGYRLQATRDLAAEIQYRYGYFDYHEQDRADHNHALSVNLVYHVADWLSVSGSSYLGWNRSNQQIFNYQAANAGGGITAMIRF